MPSKRRKPVRSTRQPVQIDALRDAKRTSEWIPIDDLKPYKNNPRINDHAVAPLARAMAEFGFVVPILIDKDNNVVAGHTRLKAAKELGLEDAHILRADHLSDAQVQAFRVIDNKMAELSNWDQDALSEEVQIMREAGVDLTQFGYSQEEVDCLAEMVDDECLTVTTGIGNANDSEDNSRAVSPRAPGRTRIVIGGFVFYVEAEIFRRWANELNTEADFEEAAVIAILKTRLGILEYEERDNDRNSSRGRRVRRREQPEEE